MFAYKGNLESGQNKSKVCSYILKNRECCPLFVAMDTSSERRILPRFRESPSFVSRFSEQKIRSSAGEKKSLKKNSYMGRIPKRCAVLIPFDRVASGFLPEAPRGPESEARWRPLDPGLSSSFFSLPILCSDLTNFVSKGTIFCTYVPATA